MFQRRKVKTFNTIGMPYHTYFHCHHTGLGSRHIGRLFCRVSLGRHSSGCNIVRQDKAVICTTNNTPTSEVSISMYHSGSLYNRFFRPVLQLTLVVVVLVLVVLVLMMVMVLVMVVLVLMVLLVVLLMVVMVVVVVVFCRCCCCCVYCTFYCPI